MTTHRVGDVLFAGDGPFTDTAARPGLDAARDTAATDGAADAQKRGANDCAAGREAAE